MDCRSTVYITFYIVTDILTLGLMFPFVERTLLLKYIFRGVRGDVIGGHTVLQARGMRV